jgi:hypothetical protein
MAVIKTAVLETKQGEEFPPRQTPFKYPGIMGKMHICMFEKGVYFFLLLTSDPTWVSTQPVIKLILLDLHYNQQTYLTTFLLPFFKTRLLHLTQLIH